ncbi:hypothetical protein ACOMHN_053933 [Nucella lapillus]
MEALQEAPQSFDEAAFKESIYTLVKSSLGLVMTNDNDLNITVDNLTPLMKGLELDTADEDVKELVMDSLLNTYGLVEPQQIDQLLLKKQMKQDLDELEDCVDAAFAVIDLDRDGIISQNDVYRLMIHLGEVLWDNQVTAILDQADIDGDRKISKKDLFLFLLGQEKRVKIEDQILNKLANKEETKALKEEEEEEEEESKPAPTKDQTKKDAAQVPPIKNLAASLKDTQPSEEAQASARRRKMFSGDGKIDMATTTDRLAEGESDSTKAGDKDEESSNVKESENVSEAEKQEVTATRDAGVDASSPEECERKAETKNENATLLPSGDWSDSGHVGSEGDADAFADDDDEGLRLECVPLALEAGICYLPAPAFDAVASPDSPHTTPRPTSQGSHHDQDGNTPPPAYLDLPPEPDTEGADAVINSARTERTSEYDSDLDGDSLPETCHQNLILQEIEQQVLHTQEALKAKEPSLGRVKLKEKYAAMITADDPGDGCESVVESEILPTYVRPCARSARSVSRLSSGRLEDVADLGEVPPPRGGLSGLGGALGGKERYCEKDQQQVHQEDYANSTAEIVSKGYISFSSPRSASTMTTKCRLNDVIDDVFSPSDKKCPQCDISRNKASFVRSAAEAHDSVIQAQVDQSVEETEMEDLDDSSVYRQTDTLVDGAPPNLRPACEHTRQLSARSRPKAPLRRSLTCRTVTVKDLSTATRSLSPQRRDQPRFAYRKPFVRPRSSHHMQSDSSPTKRDFSLSSRDMSKDAFVTKEELSAADSVSFNRLKFSNFRRTQSLGRMSFSHQRVNEPHTQRTQSPRVRMDSYRHQSMDFARSQKDASRNWISLSYRESTHARREPPRSGWESARRSQESHRSRQDSYRAQSASAVSTARSEGRTVSSVYDYDEDDESKEEFRFYGPNFDIIMSQKGEPEEFLRESLLRDALFRAGAKDCLPHEPNVDTTPRDFTTTLESRKMKISRQLERVKEMEGLIVQRREQVAEDKGEDHSFTDDARVENTHTPRRHPLRRARIATSVRTPHTSRSDHFNTFTSKEKNSRQPLLRPRSCLARGRAMSASAPKVVTIADSSEVSHSAMMPTWGPVTDTSRDTHDGPSQTTVHVVDLSSLLSGVSEPAETQNSPAAERHRTQSIRPLGRVVMAYEKPRRRQAGRVGNNNQDGRGQDSATSISRQLQKGIPYRTPTPPLYSEPPSSQTTSPHVPRCSSAHVRPCSFMLGAVEGEGSHEQTPHVVRSVIQTQRDGHQISPQHDQRLVRESVTSHRARLAGNRDAMTFEFPERSVFVVKARPVTAK